MTLADAPTSELIAEIERRIADEDVSVSPLDILPGTKAKDATELRREHANLEAWTRAKLGAIAYGLRTVTRVGRRSAYEPEG